MTASLGIAGVNTGPLRAACMGIAGNWGSTLRPHLQRLVDGPGLVMPGTLADRAAFVGWKRAALMLDFTYAVCVDRKTKRIRYRPGYEAMCARHTRRLRVYLDSTAFRRWRGKVQKWATYERYCETIDLIDPDGTMSFDTIGDQRASHAGYERMRVDGYRDVVIPVWQASQTWSDSLTPEQNGMAAAQDEYLRRYVTTHPLVAIGGLVQGPCPRAERGAYLSVIARSFPDVHLWGLGQASPLVLNQLGSRGLLDRVSTDGSWWIADAAAERLAVLQDGVIKMLSLTGIASSFIPTLDRAKSNLYSGLGAYSGLWAFPPPSQVPTDLADLEVRLELKRRLSGVQMDLFAELGVGS